MRLIHITAKRYPGSTADHHYVENMAKAFSAQLGDNFTFVVCNTDRDAIRSLPLEILIIPSFIKRTLFFFFWIPLNWFRNRKKDQATVFFSNDQNILTLLILWKKILSLNYKVAADWHMLTNTWKDSFIACYADYSFSTSKKLEKAVLRLSPFANINTVYGGVDISPFLIQMDKDNLRRQLGLPEDKFLIGYVGLFMTMGMEKGISTMIDSLEYLPEDCMMIFVGGKPNEIKHYTEVAKSKNVIDRCIFVLMQDFSNVVRYEKVMDVLVIPYPDKPHFRQYGFPMKIYEYMASGVPIIYTRLELLEEVASDCAYGVEADSPKALANAVTDIYGDRAKSKKYSLQALEKVKNYTWKERARNIINRFDIMTDMLNIPNRALKYILFQRTEFSIYARKRWLLRIVMNKKIPIYNIAVQIEALLFPRRTKKLFSLDMEREYSIIKDYIPGYPRNILDIGCGVAGIDIMLHRHYSSIGKFPDFFLLDKSEVNPKVYYGLEKEAAYYNSLDIAKDILEVNGIKETSIHTQEVYGSKIFPGQNFDLIISLISWGFHYPISTYIDQVYGALVAGGTLIVDVRKDTDGQSMLEKRFGSIKVIYEAQKYRRVVVKKTKNE